MQKKLKSAKSAKKKKRRATTSSNLQRGTVATGAAAAGDDNDSSSDHSDSADVDSTANKPSFQDAPDASTPRATTIDAAVDEISAESD